MSTHLASISIPQGKHVMLTHVQSAGGTAGRRGHRLATAAAVSLLLGSLVLLSGCVAAPGYYDQYAGAYPYAYSSYGYFAFDDFDNFDDFHHHHRDFDDHRFDHDHDHHFDHHWDDHHWGHMHPAPSPWLWGSGMPRR
jgi:hypothetical protein